MVSEAHVQSAAEAARAIIEVFDEHDLTPQEAVMAIGMTLSFVLDHVPEECRMRIAASFASRLTRTTREGLQ